MNHGTKPHICRSRSRTHQMRNSRHMNHIVCPRVPRLLLRLNHLHRRLLVLKLLEIWTVVQSPLPFKNIKSNEKSVTSDCS
ncbi:hypothetical protein Hanom_Chr12g01075601 [Helianthus anomalus]